MTKREFIGEYNILSWRNSYNHCCRVIGWELYNLDIVINYHVAQDMIIRSGTFNTRDLKITEKWLDE